ncbi:uncharacterized protein LOC144609595 [Rhinoraja longicauda]
METAQYSSSTDSREMDKGNPITVLQGYRLLQSQTIQEIQYVNKHIGLTITGAGRLRRLRERLRLALGSGRVDSDIGNSGSGSMFAHPGSRGLGRGHFTVRRGLRWLRDISLLGGGFNVGSHDRPDVQQQRQQQRVRPPRIGLIISGAGRLRRLRERLRRDAPWAWPAVDRPVRPATTTT